MYDFIILGGSGFIGRGIHCFLEKQNLKVLSIGRESRYFKKNTFMGLPQSKFTLYLAEKNHYKDNCANDLINSNLDRLESAITSAIDSKFIYFSSGLVYGDKNFTPRSINDDVHALNVYCESKLECEKLALKNKSLVIRLSNIYGKDMKHENVFTDIFKKISNDIITLKSRYPIRDFLYLPDLCHFITHASINWNQGIFNVGSGVGTQIIDLAKIFIEILGSGDKVITCDDSILSSYLVLDIELTKKTFKWEPKTNIYDGIKEILRAK
jgi:nucleoside-diphosphate-sugar epimerase